jgi:hypothetical protein
LRHRGLRLRWRRCGLRLRGGGLRLDRDRVRGLAALPVAPGLEAAGGADGQEHEREEEAADERRAAARGAGEIERQVHLADSRTTKGRIMERPG